jgi:F-type H+-transporting ATPase subunit a
MSAVLGLAGIVAVAFEKPTTKDFIWSCWGGGIEIFGISFCYNFIYFLLTIVFVAFLLLFFLAFRKPKIVPGKFQLTMESGIEFVRNQIVMQMIGPEGMPYLPLLASFFFFILLGNLLEVTPFLLFPLNSRLAFPVVLAIISWATYNAVGIARHGFFGYFKMVMFPPGVPVAIYLLLTPIELLQVVIIRPLTLAVRLFANMVAGHFLLAVFFLGSIALFSGAPYILGAVSFGMGVLLMGFEIFVAALQAFIFAVLTASYIGGAMAEEH